jgi:hypothetical protein
MLSPAVAMVVGRFVLAVDSLHQFSVDGSGGFEFFGGAPECFCGFEELLVESGDSQSELLVGDLSDHFSGQHLVG